MERRQNYSLCPRAEDSRPRLHALVNDFANEQQATLINRGQEAENELSGMTSSKGVFERTGGKLIALAVDKPSEFRLSLSNLGLEQKVALAVISYRGEEMNAQVRQFLSDLSSFWVVQPVEAGVTDDPPCDRKRET
jgi:hypothetical protein